MAHAAKKAPRNLTGKNVKDGTLTGADFKDGTLGPLVFGTEARTLRIAGPQGPTGDTGPAGPRGLQGQTGAPGSSAARAYSYITAEDTTCFVGPCHTNLINPAIKDCGEDLSTLNYPDNCLPWAPWYPHWAYDCGGAEWYCGLGNSIGGAGQGATLLQNAADGVIGFTGDENGSFVSLMGPGNVIVTGTITLLERPDGYHSRVSCQPQIRLSNSGQVYTNLGVPTVVSADDDYLLVHIAVTGGGFVPEAGDYDYQISCRMLDEFEPNTEFGDWYFINGNATAFTTEK